MVNGFNFAPGHPGHPVSRGLDHARCSRHSAHSSAGAEQPDGSEVCGGQAQTSCSSLPTRIHAGYAGLSERGYVSSGLTRSDAAQPTKPSPAPGGGRRGRRAPGGRQPAGSGVLRVGLPYGRSRRSAGTQLGSQLPAALSRLLHLRLLLSSSGTSSIFLQARARASVSRTPASFSDHVSEII